MLPEIRWYLIVMSPGTVVCIFAYLFRFISFNCQLCWSPTSDVCVARVVAWLHETIQIETLAKHRDDD